MKVLKKGREQTGWSKEYVCTGGGNGDGGCGTKLLVEKDDLFATYGHCRDEMDSFVTFRCACCGVLTDIKGCPIYASELLDGRAWEVAHGFRESSSGR